MAGEGQQVSCTDGTTFAVAEKASIAAPERTHSLVIRPGFYTQLQTESKLFGV